MRKLLLFLVAVLLFVSCGELLLVTIKLNYPFDDKSADTYTVDVTKAMDEADAALKSQTSGVVDTILKEGESALTKELQDKYGNDIQLDFSYNPKPTIGLDELLVFLNGKSVTQDLTSTVTIKDATGNVIGTETKTVATKMSICDFGDNLTFDFGDVRILLKNVVTYCADTTTDSPYLYMEQTTDPVIIKLSENDDMKDYLHYMDKIFSATINDIGFTVLDVPDGLKNTNNSGSTDETEISLVGDFFAQPIDFMKQEGGSWVQCDRTKKPPATGCQWIGVNPDNGQPEDFFAGDNVTPDGKYYEQFYSVGSFVASGIEKDDQIFLQYTYFGKDILQNSIKALDFKTGVKARYTFKAGAKRLSGKFVAKINAEFLMVVEPF